MKRDKPEETNNFILKMFDSEMESQVEASALAIKYIYRTSNELKGKYNNNVNQCVAQELRALQGSDNLFPNLLRESKKICVVPGGESAAHVKNLFQNSFNDVLLNLGLKEAITNDMARKRTAELIESYIEKNLPPRVQTGVTSASSLATQNATRNL